LPQFSKDKISKLGNEDSKIKVLGFENPVSLKIHIDGDTSDICLTSSLSFSNLRVSIAPIVASKTAKLVNDLLLC
jgi:hypothetical protein